MSKKIKICIEGTVTLKFTEEINVTPEEYEVLQNAADQPNIVDGSKAFDILFQNIDADDYNCAVDEYSIDDIEKID